MSLQIIAADGRRGLARFIDVPWHIHDPRGPTPWVPPLRAVVADLLDDRRNPFYQNASRALFVAEDAGRFVGRVAAIENRGHNEHHADRVGFFGFFDSIDDQGVAAGLLEAAETWLRGRGLEIARGPISPSMNHECGLLVDGFDAHPMVMTPWNPRYQPPLLEGSGYQKAKDLVAYYVTGGPDTEAEEERVRALGERVRKRTGLTFRHIDFGNLKAEARRILSLYNEAWSENWGFVPPSGDEFWHTAHGLKAILGRNFSFVAEAGGEVVGFMLIAHDLNRILQRIPSGRLWPWNIVRVLWGARRVLTGRVMLLGVRSEYRRRGILPLFAFEMIRRGREVGGEGVEASWILEDNEALRAPLEALGLQPYRRWRIYEKGLSAG